MSTWRKIGGCLATVVGLALGALAYELPEGYTRLQYIQSNRSGSTRIVTNYTPQPNNDIIEAVFEPVVTNVTQAIWCARGKSATTSTFSLFLIGDKLRYDYGDGTTATGTPFGMAEPGAVYSVVASNNVVTVNGVVGQTFDSVTYTAGNPLMLFGRYHNNTTQNLGDYADIKLYSFKVWRKGELIHNFIPCTDADDAATLYDVGTSPCTFSKAGTITAGPAAVSAFKVEAIPDQYRIVGAMTPEPVVTDSETGNALVKDRDYTLAYANNDAAGTGIITITGKDGTAYAGKSETVYFNIYQYVKSITSNGNQYINTGIVPGPTTAVEMHFNTTNCGASAAMFGAGTWNANSSYAFVVDKNSWYSFLGSATTFGFQYDLGVDASISVSTNAENNCTIDIGGNRVTRTVSLAYSGTNPIDIFASGNGGAKSKMTLYSFKVWKDGELVRDFVPVRGANDAGLLDLVTTNFFKNVGSGTFAAGQDLADFNVAKIPNQFYANAAVEPILVVSNFAGTVLLEKGVDYTVTYESNDAVGTGKATVTGIGAYKGVVVAEFAIYSAAPAPAMGANAYVQHGLIHHWDGLDNAGTGAFDSAAKIWKDLKGGLDFTLDEQAQWGGGFIEMDRFAGAAAGKTGKYLTMEIKLRNTKARRGMPFTSGYGVNRVVWNFASNQLWFHHQNNLNRYTLTGLASSGTTYDLAVVYGAASGAGDAPMLFYNGGTRLTSGISNQKSQSAYNWISASSTATIGGGTESLYSYSGCLYSIRLYSCPLTPQEIAYNAAVDKVRYDGVAPAEAFNSSDMRWNATSGKVEVLVSVGAIKGNGSFSVNGGGASEWVSAGDEVTVVYTPADGEAALEWFDLPDGVLRSGDRYTITFAAEAPVAARLQMRTKIDLSRALNADPGCEEGSGYFNDGGNKTFMPASWRRTADRAYLGTFSTTSDQRGYHFLRPYQGNVFSQSGLALPAGEYTLTFEHAAEATDHTISAWQLVNTNNVAQTIGVVTNEMRVYGTSWHTVQTDFTIAEDGIYKLQVVNTASGSSGNCYANFDNISITSDTDLHIEVGTCYPYLGEQVRPPVVVRDDAGNVLTEGADYELLYGANNSVGSGFGENKLSYQHGNGYVAARGLGAHYGVAGANFRIGRPIYVKPDGSAANGGTSWADAVDFATALSLAAAHTENSEIWVAGSNVLASAAATRIFYGNVMIRGGFAGGETSIEEREDGAYAFVDGAGEFSAVVFKDCANVHFERMVFCGSPSRAVSKVGYSGCVYIDDCVFENNGNAVYVQGIDKSPLEQGGLYVRNSVFRDNVSENAADGAAAIYGYLLRHVSAENTLFTSNALASSSNVKTSAILAKNAPLELRACDFIGNVGEGATYGTVRSMNCDAADTIEHCLFRGNRTDGANAAVVTVAHGSLTAVSKIVNCTFAANTNAVAGGCAGVKGVKGVVNVRNSIFYGNGIDLADGTSCSFDVDYTLLADDAGATCSLVNAETKVGSSMTYGDPLFAAADDCHVLSEAGYFDATGGIHYAAEDVRSPAIDAGDPASDYSRETPNNGGCVNLGCYGNTEQASRTPVALPEVDGEPQVAWNDPEGFSRPTVSFTMGGSGSYTAQAIVYVSTDGGETWENVSGLQGGLVRGATREFVVPTYYDPGSTIKVKVWVSGAGHESESAVASVTVSGTLPPWHGKKGPENVVHVRPGATGKNDGTSWSDAYQSFYEAVKTLDAFKNEVWFAGTNVVLSDVGSFSFANQAVLRGGFTGVETSPEERPAGLRSLLDGQDLFDTFNFVNTAPLTIDSIEFRRGAYRGLKKSASSGDLELTNCVFACNSILSDWEKQGNINNNKYCYSGGGGASLYGSGSASLRIVNCAFVGNKSKSGSQTGAGGGAFVSTFARTYIDSSLFATNISQANHQGATSCGFQLYDTPGAVVTNCSFRGNKHGSSSGGCTAVGVHGNCNGTVFANCDFVGNHMTGAIGDYGGSIVTVRLSAPASTCDFRNCTFAFNTVNNSTVLFDNVGTVSVKNSIFHHNFQPTSSTYPIDVYAWDAANATVAVDYCLHGDTTAGFVNGRDGNVPAITACEELKGLDPQFVSSDDDVAALVGTEAWPDVGSISFDIYKMARLDVHLLSSERYYDNAGETNAVEGVLSPAIDAADPNDPVGDEPAPNGKRRNLGAYGGTAWASLTPVAEPAIEDVELTFEGEFTQPTVRFRLGGKGAYRAVVQVKLTTDGESWCFDSGEMIGYTGGNDYAYLVPTYLRVGGTVTAKVFVKVVDQVYDGGSAPADVVGKLPPWDGKGGAPERVIHVRAGATGRGDGSSWTHAVPEFASAVDLMTSDKCEMWIANTNVMTGLAVTHSLGFPAKILGGFTGVENAAAERPKGYRSVLDGENTWDILIVNNSAPLVIENVEFVRGTNRGFKKVTSSGDLTLSNCVFYGNSQGSGKWECQSNAGLNYQHGGGGASLYGTGSAKLTVADCRFEANISSSGGNCGWGGGLFAGNFGGGAEIVRCAFATNYMSQAFTSAGGSMAAMHLYNTRATVEDCSFYGHRANGAVDIRDACAGSVFRRCSFVGNYGGSTAALTVQLSNATDPATVENCTFAYNLTTPALNCAKGAVAVTNCIFYGNLAGTTSTAAADLRVAADATASVDYCLFAVEEADGSTICVSEAVAGALKMGDHCLYGDPLFVTPGETVLTDVKATAGTTFPRVLPAKWSNVPSYARLMTYNVHLRGGAGYFDETTGSLVTDFRRGPNSPAIDAGDPAVACVEPVMPQIADGGGRVNLGAYGNTPWATMTRVKGAFLRVR